LILDVPELGTAVRELAHRRLSQLRSGSA
jgi:hypothetical protein